MSVIGGLYGAQEVYLSPTITLSSGIRRWCVYAKTRGAIIFGGLRFLMVCLGRETTTAKWFLRVSTSYGNSHFKESLLTIAARRKSADHAKALYAKYREGDYTVSRNSLARV